MSHLISQQIALLQPLDAPAMLAAQQRQQQLTKPPGSLGRLEALAIQIAGIRRQAGPHIRRPVIIVLAADHGIARRGVSAYPAEVTAQMVANFLRGGAAINVLARTIGAQVVVADLGVASELAAHPALMSRKIGYGTNDFSTMAAMSSAQAIQAIEAGIEIVQQQIAQGADLIATGEMGIANTTASSALVAALTGQPAAQVTGRGTGVSDSGLAHKIAIIEQALALHQPNAHDPIGVLAALGGFEIAGLVGVLLGAAAQQVPVVVDGFITGAAALVACRIAPALQPYLIAGHRSVERGHHVILDTLHLAPLLDLDLRLGEGSGAAIAMSLCITACKLHNEMATFTEAGVAGGTS
jgi:nicotinate-nucleotide--dimethylbenzimidazole phosphoribosyltransferase